MSFQIINAAKRQNGEKMINLEREIREQPSVLSSVISNNESVAEKIVAAAKEKGICGIYFAARGTSDHACIYGQYIFGILAGLPCTLGTPSVFTKYNSHVDLSKYLVIGVSQSGKAEDVLEVLKSAKSDGAVTVAITNDTSSPMAGEAEYHLYCGAGPEVSIAATKTFTSQMMLLALLAAKWSCNEQFLNDLKAVPAKVNELIDSLDTKLEELAVKCENIPGAVILGRGVSYSIALEGALKMLETNKIKMKGYPISDFHHGPIAQLHEGDMTFVIAPKGVTFDDAIEITNKLKNVKSDIIFITDDASAVPDGVTEVVVPDTGSEFTSAFVTVLVFQILACKLTILRGIDPDKAGVINKITITK